MKIVYVAPQSPYPPRSGGALRIEALRRCLAAIAELRLFVLGDRPGLEARRWLRTHAGRVFPSRREDLPRRLLRIGRAALRRECIPAARYLSRRRVARLVGALREFGPDVIVLGEVYQMVLLPALAALGARIVVDTHDAASRVHARIAAASANPITKLGFRLLARDTRRVEERFLPQIERLWTVSDDDADYYRRELGLARVDVVPNVVEFPAAIPVAEEEPGSAVFTGSFAYWPNEDAALRLIDLSRGLASAGTLRRVYIVGKEPTDRMQRAAAGQPHVVVTGCVPDVSPYLTRAEVVAVPLAAGSGTKLKVLEAMALARPVLTTPIGAEGLGLTPGVHAEVVPLDRFAEALGALLRDPGRRRALGRAGREWAEQRYSIPALETRLRELLLPGAG